MSEKVKQFFSQDHDSIIEIDTQEVFKLLNGLASLGLVSMNRHKVGEENDFLYFFTPNFHKISIKVNEFEEVTSTIIHEFDTIDTSSCTVTIDVNRDSIND